eukprot:Pompholyxophrys_punicea_v1_NODE_1651_length_584_cov_3.861818.p2 type:complete len:104 gc:universal NODE_1651_length_584_cov_3.861818:168-479(+)
MWEERTQNFKLSDPFGCVLLQLQSKRAHRKCVQKKPRQDSSFTFGARFFVFYDCFLILIILVLLFWSLVEFLLCFCRGGLCEKSRPNMTVDLRIMILDSLRSI